MDWDKMQMLHSDMSMIEWIGDVVVVEIVEEPVIVWIIDSVMMHVMMVWDVQEGIN
jgi:hypothetical protein